MISSFIHIYHGLYVTTDEQLVIYDNQFVGTETRRNRHKSNSRVPRWNFYSLALVLGVLLCWVIWWAYHIACWSWFFKNLITFYSPIESQHWYFQSNSTSCDFRFRILQYCCMLLIYCGIWSTLRTNRRCDKLFKDENLWHSLYVSKVLVSMFKWRFRRAYVYISRFITN